jgi:hypothetical protein
MIGLIDIANVVYHRPKQKSAHAARQRPTPTHNRSANLAFLLNPGCRNSRSPKMAVVPLLAIVNYATVFWAATYNTVIATAASHLATTSAAHCWR